eukprot:12431372-Karenia_brevis.AAC.1
MVWAIGGLGSCRQRYHQQVIPSSAWSATGRPFIPIAVQQCHSAHFWQIEVEVAARRLRNS